MTEYLVPGHACKDCAYIANAKEKQVDTTARMVVVEGLIPLKVGWNIFRWILGGVTLGVILVLGANFTMLTMNNNDINVVRLELSEIKAAITLNQTVREKDIEALSIKVDNFHK